MPRRAIPFARSLQALFPDKAAEFAEDLNGFPASECAAKSATHRWWRCREHEHTWEAPVWTRTVRGARCPFCAGKRVWPGFNDLAFKHPHLMPEWHSTKNLPLLPSEVMPGSVSSVWWRCAAQGHEWEASPANRVRGTKCPYCQGAKACKKTTALSIKRPDLSAEWDFSRNGGLTPEGVTPGSMKYVWWLCPEHGHSYQQYVKGRSNGAGCYYCSGQKLMRTFNDLRTKRPELVSEWDFQKNGDAPEDYRYGSNHVAWWLCPDYGHSYAAKISNRSGGSRTGCPYCSNDRVLLNFNDLAWTDKEIAAGWHPSRNGALKPTQITRGASKDKVWWLCSQDPSHEWRATPAQRTGKYGSGCPDCATKANSKAETSMREWLTAGPLGLPSASRRLKMAWRTKNTMEVDFIGRLQTTGARVAVEYDGSWWHAGDDRVKRDIDKTKALLAAGFWVIRIREDPLPDLPVSHDRLHQLSLRWHDQEPGLAVAVEQIEYWLEAMDTLPA